MIQKTQYLLLSLNITIKICSKNPLFSYSLQSIKLLLCPFSHQINLSKCSFSNFLKKFKGRKSDCFNFLILPYKLIHFKYILFSPKLSLFFLFLILSWNSWNSSFLNVLILKHLFNHTSVIGSIAIKNRLFLFWFVFLENLRDLCGWS